MQPADNRAANIDRAANLSKLQHWGNEIRNKLRPSNFIGEQCASESLPKHRGTPTLVIVRPQPPAAQLRLKRPVLSRRNAITSDRSRSH
jgi:hypothetical protein